MNMMVNASELVGSEAEKNKISEMALKKAVSKLVASWEKKQAARAKKIGGLGFLAVSLAACNSSSDDTATPATPAPPASPGTFRTTHSNQTNLLGCCEPLRRALGWAATSLSV